ncbi:hypothetical protein [Crateriforma spongiae]|uniref:hypothetical protein n=1 Tax=Crateriforma spongiae TaxID=2724528 RepID=UPI0039B098D1
MQRRSLRTDALNQLTLQAGKVFASERRDLQAGSGVVCAVDLVNVLRCLTRSGIQSRSRGTLRRRPLDVFFSCPAVVSGNPDPATL